MRFDEKQKETLKRAALLMRTVAEAGCQSFYEDGSPTPNRELHLEIAADLEALAADLTLINEGNIEQASPPQWIPVSERLPKEDSRVLITGWEWNDAERGERFVVMSCYALGTWWAEGREGVEEFYPPTHWLEVPPLPTKSA